MAHLVEGAAYLLLVGASLVGILAAMLVAPSLSGGAYAVVWALSPEWVSLLGATLLFSFIAFIAGPWRVRRRLALWYFCATIVYLAVVALTQRPEPSIPWLRWEQFVAVSGLVALASCSILPVVWLIRLLILSWRATRTGALHFP